MAGNASLLQKIGNAFTLAKVGYKGSGGIGEMLADIQSILLNGTAKVIDDLSTLSIISPADTKIVLVKDVALYVYNSAGTAGSLDVVTSPGGRWQFIVALGPTTFSQVIGNSSAGTTSFTINHGLGTLTPTILCYEPAAPGGTSGYVLREITTLADVTTVDADNTTIDFGATVPATSQYLIVAKK